MKKYLLIFSIMVLFVPSAEAKVNVFACTPEWASLTREIAGDRVTIFTATTVQQDPHTITARPSLIAKMRGTDLLVCTGAGLEAGWLPVLQQTAGKRSVQASGENVIMAARLARLLEVPEKIDRSMGDVHPEGNPHVHLNPNNLLPVSDAILERLSALDPANKSFFEERHKEFRSKLQSQIKAWTKQAEPLRGMVVISNHPNMAYLYNWLGIVCAGTLEPLPGVPPTSRHLSQLVTIAQNRNVTLIDYVPFENSTAAKWLSDKTGIPYVEMPFTVGGGGTEDLFQLFERTIQILLSKR